MVMNKVIQNEIIRLAAETGAKAAMEAMEKQKRKVTKSNVLAYMNRM